jgi:hypothetical protein
MLDDKTKALIIKYLRKAWLYSPARRQVIKAAKSDQKNAEGEPLYYCHVCTPSHLVVKGYVDHKLVFIPLTGFDSFDGIIDRLFDTNNMQFICRKAHKEKTDKENKQRKRKIKK